MPQTADKTTNAFGRDFVGLVPFINPQVVQRRLLENRRYGMADGIADYTQFITQRGSTPLSPQALSGGLRLTRWTHQQPHHAGYYLEAVRVSTVLPPTMVRTADWLAGAVPTMNVTIWSG
jgi:hypothetical protein